MCKKRIFSVAGIFFATGLLLSCAPAENTDNSYRAEVIVTSYGIPHITADDFGSLGFGEGYMAAKDHVCNIAFGIMEVRAERAKYLGAGAKNIHLKSDVMVRALQIPDHAAANFAAESEENRSWLTGYTDGYNLYIREVGRDNITSWCKGAEWVRQITPQDLFARFHLLAQTTPYMADMILSATPPEQNISSMAIDPPTYAAIREALAMQNLGSNGWAFGRDRTENGRGMLLGNPHYPWTGNNRFWEKHLIIPGKMNIYGVHLVGAPGVAIGFNENIGWTHTVSNSKRVIFYKLNLVPGDPTSYYYDGEMRKMTSRKIAISVKGENGQQESITRTIWFSHYGMMASLPDAPWTENQALTLRDANWGNMGLMNQWKEMNLAGNMDSFKQVHRTGNAMPWVNTMATSRDGRAVFIDGSNVGRLSAEAIDLWRERKLSDPLTKVFYDRMGLILLDGSDSRFEWQSHDEARASGIVPYTEQPKYDRRDYIFNSNDSHWLTHVGEPLTGYSPLFGAEESPRTLRTRINAKMLSDTGSNGPAGADGKFSLREMQNTLLLNRSLTAELLLDDLVSACIEENSAIIEGMTVDLTDGCAALSGYDKHLNLDSKGAVLFREWVEQYDYGQTFNRGPLFAVAFDPADPVNSPRELADKNLARQNLAKAILVMQRAGLALNVSLGEVQFAYRAGEKTPLHGGNSADGVASLIDQRVYYTLARQVRGRRIEGSKHLTDKGYAITGGSSFILSLSYEDDGPRAEAFLTYSQSGDPSSPHYTDQTKLFSAKLWRPVLYSEDDISKDMKDSFILTGPRP